LLGSYLAIFDSKWVAATCALAPVAVDVEPAALLLLEDPCLLRLLGVGHPLPAEWTIVEQVRPNIS
jgi:hypothetical protein